MKTPHTINLVRSGGVRRYDPVKDRYIDPDYQVMRVPCLANYLSQQRIFELYGNRTDRVLTVRFNQKQEPFDKAFFDGKTFVPVDAIDAPIKGSVRLKEVVNNGV